MKWLRWKIMSDMSFFGLNKKAQLILILCVLMCTPPAYKQCDSRLSSDGTTCWHTVHFLWEVEHPPTTWSTNADKSLWKCFSSPVWVRQIHPSRPQTITSFLLLNTPMKGGGRLQERERGRENYICLTVLHCRLWLYVLCVRAPGTGRPGPTIL